MAVTAWVASHTGLPSFYVTANERITAGDRVLRAPGGPTLLSDALAAPGAPTVYTVGGEAVTLVRDGGEWWEHLVTDATGRGVPGLIGVGNGDPIGWSSAVSRFNARVTRWPIEDPAKTGVSVVALLDPEREGEVWRVLKRRAPIIVSPGAPTIGLPLRCVTVDSVSRRRFVMGDPDAAGLQFDVAWTEALGVSGAAPVVTWGEWAAYGDALLAEWGVGPGVEVRRNDALNPIPAGSATGWFSGFGNGAGTTSLDTTPGDGPEGRTGFRRGTFTTAATNPLGAGHWVRFDGSLGVRPAGTPYPCSAWFRSSVALTAQPRLLARQNNANVGAEVFLDVVNIPANTWVRLGGTIAPTGDYDAVQLRLSSTSASSTVPAGSTMDMGSALFGDGGAYFDGSYSPYPELVPSWLGPANGSPSVLRVASGWQHWSALEVAQRVAGMPS